MQVEILSLILVLHASHRALLSEKHHIALIFHPSPEMKGKKVPCFEESASHSFCTLKHCSPIKMRRHVSHQEKLLLKLVKAV